MQEQREVSRRISVLRDLPIVEIKTGSTAGRIKEVIVNPLLQDIYLVIGTGSIWSRRVLNSRDVIGIGRDYLLIRSADDVRDIEEDSEKESELDEYFPIIGITAIDIHGNELGHVIDFELHEKQGELFNIELAGGHIFSGSQIVSVCSKYIFIEADASQEYNMPSVPKREAASDEAADENENRKLTEEPEDSSGLLPAGLRVTKELHSDDGEYTIKPGTVLTDEIIREADHHNMLAEVALHTV